MDISFKNLSSRKKKTLKISLIIIIALVIIRLLLPYVVLHYANKKLASLNGYYGKIDDIDLALIRGAYVINDIYIHKVDSVSNEETEFFDAREIDLSVEWRALFHGKIVGEIEVESPSLNFEKDKTEPKQVEKDSSDLKKLLDDFMPLRINHFAVHNGAVHYIDKTKKPSVDVYADNIKINAENLTTIETKSTLPSSLDAQAQLYGGTLNLNMKFDPLAEHPTFDLNAEVQNVQLELLNDFFKAYTNMDVNKGNFSLFVEGAGKEGKFVGYFKPLIKDLKIVGPEDKKDDALQKLWEGVAAAGAFIFKNQKKDQLATKVPIEGTFKDTGINVWRAVAVVLRNAFVQALQPAIDGEINLSTVDEQQEKKEGFFNRIFDKKDEKKSKQKN